MILGSGINPEYLCNEFLIMNNNNKYYKDLEFVGTDTDIDYYVIISYAMDDHHVPNKTIIFQMEPWVYDDTKQWGIKMWGEWAKPDKTKYMHVQDHERYLNPAQWFFVAPEKVNMKRKDKAIAIISSKLVDTGHINRVNFIRYAEEQGYNIIDIYGYENYHGFKNYKGTLDDKTIMEQYKYVFSVENNNEHNYATEKIWESFISCSLCFYDGCPNLHDYINPLAYIAVDSSNQKETLSTMLDAMKEDLWYQRLSYLKEAKEKTMKEYNALEVAHRVIKNNI